MSRTCAHAVHNVREQGVHVLSNRDGGDDLLHGVLHDVEVGAGELIAQLADLACDGECVECGTAAVCAQMTSARKPLAPNERVAPPGGIVN